MNKYDSYLWEVEKRLWDKYGVTAGGRFFEPLKWYFQTGRDSYTFRNALLATKPFLIARDLAKGGSYDEAIARIKKRIKC